MPKWKELKETFEYAGPILRTYPAWAHVIFSITALLCVTSVLVLIVKFSYAQAQLDPSRRLRLPVIPDATFAKDFEDIVAPYRLPDSGSILHVVWGDLSRIRNMTVVLPINQSFDFINQRGSESTLKAFESHSINGKPFFQALDALWPNRPRRAGLGTVKYQDTTGDSNGLQGVILAVTTRNRSSNPEELGLYVNTPLDAIDFVLDEVLKEAKRQNVQVLALPLIGTGYANIGRTENDPKMRGLLQQIVILFALQKLISALQDPSSPIRRGILVLYDKDDTMQSQADSVWALVPTFLARDEEKREKMILDLLDRFTKSAEGARSQKTDAAGVASP